MSPEDADKLVGKLVEEIAAAGNTTPLRLPLDGPPYGRVAQARRQLVELTMQGERQAAEVQRATRDPWVYLSAWSMHAAGILARAHATRLLAQAEERKGSG